MVTTVQSTPQTVRTVTSRSGMILPAIITPQTDLNIGLTAIATFYRMAGCKGSWDTAMRVTEALHDSSAVVTLYIGADGGQDARVLWPNAVSITKDNNLVARCYCTLRREVKTFRLDPDAPVTR